MPVTPSKRKAGGGRKKRAEGAAEDESPTKNVKGEVEA